MKAPAPARRDRLREMLADLKMPGALEAVDGILSEADSGTLSAAEAIEQLLNAQILLRNNRRLQTAMRASRLPAVKTLDQFDFAFQPSIKREQIESLHELGFLDRGENVIYLGPPGVGKTHLAISLAIAAAQSGRRVYYGTLAGLIESLTEAKAAGNLSRRLRVLTHPALLVVDEIGYLAVVQHGAVLMIQLINARHKSQLSTRADVDHRLRVTGAACSGDEVMAAARSSTVWSRWRWPHRKHSIASAPRIRDASEPSAGRLGSAPQEGCVVTAGQNGSSNGGRPPAVGCRDVAARLLAVTAANPVTHCLSKSRHPQHRRLAGSPSQARSCAIFDWPGRQQFSVGDQGDHLAMRVQPRAHGLELATNLVLGEQIEYTGLDDAVLAHCRLRRLRGLVWNQ